MKPEFQLYVMRHDKPSAVLAERLADLNPIVLDLPSGGGFEGVKLRLTDLKRKVATTISDAFRGQELDKIPLVVYGSGKNHHYTYGLCRELADKRSPRYTYVHIDQHDDFGSSLEYEDTGRISCGNFVAQILADTNAKPSVHIGQNFLRYYMDLFDKQTGFSEKIFSMDLRKKKKIFKRMPNLFSRMRPKVYVSMDLDVLQSGIVTDYGNGMVSPKELLAIVQRIKHNRDIIGLDICGLTEDHEIDEQSIQTHRDLINCVID